ncbi:MAG: sodium:solute symporter [Sulfurimonadaceae bacterium]
MESSFATIDWIVFGSYFAMLIISSIFLSQTKIENSRDYFVGGNTMPMWAVAISVLATTQSAATFLGGPEYAYKHDLTFLGFYISALLGVIFVAKVLIPRFYAINAVTVYELLETRYGASAKKNAGVMFLVGRLFASGARLYIGALAISMILFMDIEASHVALSILILVTGALAYTYFGGVKSVIYSDVIQAVTYITAALVVLFYLYTSIQGDFSTIVSTLATDEKLRLFDFSLDFSSAANFNVWGLMTGWFLLNIAAYGLDQDMTQRVLSCKDKKEGERAIIISVLMTIPVVVIFLFIGLLLYLFYNHPELSVISGGVEQSFAGEKITILMYYILHEMPEGLRGLVTVGAIAAALSSTNSVLGAMSSVAIEDLYKPWKQKRSDVSEYHFVKAARAGVLVFAVLLSAMAMLSYYWQQYSAVSLLSFALGVMAFAYSGLLGVYFSAIFTKRGSEQTVLFALVGGFMTVLFLQPYILGMVIDYKLGFAWQIVIGTIVAFGIMQLGSPMAREIGNRKGDRDE